MKAYDLYEWIDSLSQDIDFSYKGKLGSICPFSRTDIALCYDGFCMNVCSVEEAMQAPFIDGKSLSELCDQIDI